MKTAMVVGIMSCVFMFGGCDKLLKKDAPEPKIESHCVMNGYGAGKCSFTNKGGAGSSCVKVKVFRNDGKGTSVTSSTICSGKVGTRETKSKEFSIPGVNALCAERGTVWTKVCAFTVLADN